jgi:hypothetical protein
MPLQKLPVSVDNQLRLGAGLREICVLADSCTNACAGQSSVKEDEMT